MGAPLEIEPLGLGFIETDVAYDELEAVGDRPLGETPPERYAEPCGIESVDRYELAREEAAAAAGESEWPWGMVASLGVGDDREVVSRRRIESASPVAPCAEYSSGGGLAARRFWPAAAYISSSCRRLSDWVSSMSISSAAW